MKNNDLSGFAKALGKKGGLATKKNKPPDYFSKLGKYANQVRWGKKPV